MQEAARSPGMATSSGLTAGGWRPARIHLIYYNLCLLLLPLNPFCNSTALIGSDPQCSGEPASAVSKAWKATPARRLPEFPGCSTGAGPQLGRRESSTLLGIDSYCPQTGAINPKPVKTLSCPRVPTTARSRYENTCPGIILVTPQL